MSVLDNPTTTWFRTALIVNAVMAFVIGGFVTFGIMLEGGLTGYFWGMLFAFVPVGILIFANGLAMSAWRYGHRALATVLVAVPPLAAVALAAVQNGLLAMIGML